MRRVLVPPVMSSVRIILPVTFREVSFASGNVIDAAEPTHTHIISLWRVSSDGRRFGLMRRRLGVQCPCGPLSFSLVRVPRLLPNVLKMYVLKMYVHGQGEETCRRVWMECCTSVVTGKSAPLRVPSG